MAILVDGAVLGFGYLLIGAGIGAAASRSSATSASSPASAGTVFFGVAFALVVAAIPAAIYYGALNGSRRGQTLGKMALGIAVRDSRSGGPIGFWRACGRSLITTAFTIALYIPFLIDSLAPLWDVRRQAWHDKLAHSVVVDLRP